MFFMKFPPQIQSKNPDNKQRKGRILQKLRDLKDGEVFNLFESISTNPIFARIQKLIIACLTINPKMRPTSQELLAELLAKIDELSPQVEKKDA